MVDVQPRNQQSTSTQWLSKAIRLYDEASELTALELLYETTGDKPDFDLTADPTTNETIIVLTKDEFALVSRRLMDLDVRFEEIPVKPMSELSPDIRKHARGYGV
jgi:hypothetical protein